MIQKYKFSREEADKQINAMFNIKTSNLETSEVLQLTSILNNIDYEKKTPNQKEFPGVFDNDMEENQE